MQKYIEVDLAFFDFNDRLIRDLEHDIMTAAIINAAKDIAYPNSLMMAQHWTAGLYYRRQEVPAVQVQAEALLSLATVQGSPSWVGHGTFWRGWALSMQGQDKAGLAQMNYGLATLTATGQMNMRQLCLVLMAEAMGQAGQVM